MIWFVKQGLTQLLIKFIPNIIKSRLFTARWTYVGITTKKHYR